MRWRTPYYIVPLSVLACASDPATTTAPRQSTTTPATAPAPATSSATSPATEQLTIASEVFKLEIAADDASREKGLMHRDHIDPHGGMLFIHPEPKVQSYWMANCPIDMDILFLDPVGRIVATHKMKAELPKRDDEARAEYEARLKLYDSKRPAQFAIELKAGSIERLKLKSGQVIALDLARLKKLAH